MSSLFALLWLESIHSAAAALFRTGMGPVLAFRTNSWTRFDSAPKLPFFDRFGGGRALVLGRRRFISFRKS